MNWLAKIKDSLLIFKDILLDFLKNEHSYKLGFFLVVILGFLFELAGWWYLMILAGGLAGFLMKKPALFSILVGFSGIAVVWLGFFIYFMILGPIFELTALIASILVIFESFPEILLLITIIVGGLLGGLGAINGSYIASMIYSQKESTQKLEIIDKKSI